MLLAAAPEPECLREQRQSGNNWLNLPGQCKQAVRRRLLEIQQGMCIYCERRLQGEQFHTEHLRSQTAHDENTLDWGNLSLSCEGEFGSCGHRKGKRFLPVLPQDFSQAYPFRVMADGTIKPKEDDKQLVSLLQIVNLNGEATRDFNLRNLRGSLFEGLLESLTEPPELSQQQCVAIAHEFWQQRGCPSTAMSVLEACGMEHPAEAE